MKILFILTISNIKMYFRNKGALIWTLFFPFIIILIFGLLDFAKFSTSKIGIVTDEKSTQYAETIKTALTNISENNKIEEGTIEEEKEALVDDDRVIVLEFYDNEETKKVEVKAYINKGSEQASQSLFLIIQKILTDLELQVNHIEPIFTVSSEICIGVDLLLTFKNLRFDSKLLSFPN